MCTVAFVITSCNNNGKVDGELSHKDSVLFKQIKSIQRQLQKDIFRLYPTKNMYTFLELNTITGQIWIVQWSIEDDKRFSYVLDTNERITQKEKPVSGRFSLHPTDNMYNYILLDNINGRCWQVQWSFDEDKRLVLPIQ
jgi:hypothetical protein